MNQIVRKTSELILFILWNFIFFLSFFLSHTTNTHSSIHPFTAVRLKTTNAKKNSPPSSKSLNILGTNVSEKSNNIRYNVRANNDAAPLNASAFPQSDIIRNGSVLSESDKLPWPILYGGVTPEFKWKVMLPTNTPHSHQNPIGVKHTIEMTDENLVQEFGTTSNGNGSMQMPTHIYPSFTITEHSQSDQPYEFESIHPLSNFNTSPTINFSDDIYAQPIEHESTQSEDEHRTNDGEIHIKHINHEYVAWVLI